MTYEKKVEFAIKLLQSIPTEDGPVEISYSGGKDSDVILELAKMAGINYRAIYKQTTIDPPGTTAHCKSRGVEILRPKETFFHLVERWGPPTRRARFCCRVLKEYAVLPRAVHGIRRSESVARKERYHEPEVCRVYNKKQKVRVYLPILEWTDADVERFLKERGVKCAPVYYDEKGKFHVERRLGCIGCPLASDNGRASYLQYPKMLKTWLKCAKRYLDTHPDTGTAKKFPDVYHLAFHNLFCNSYEEYELLCGGGQLFDSERINPKEYLEGYFKIDLTV